LEICFGRIQYLGPCIKYINFMESIPLPGKCHLPWPLVPVQPIELRNWDGCRSHHEDVNVKVVNYTQLCIRTGLLRKLRFAITQNTMWTGSSSVWPSQGLWEAYVDSWCSFQFGDAYFDLWIHQFDTYTSSKVNSAPLLNPNITWWPHSMSALQDVHYFLVLITGPLLHMFMIVSKLANVSEGRNYGESYIYQVQTLFQAINPFQITNNPFPGVIFGQSFQ